MNCQQGDKAVIVFSINPKNVGRIVDVTEYIGKFSEREQFQFRGLVCQAPVTDHYWWIEADDIDIQLGPSPRAYIADSWLRPIRPEEKSAKQKASKGLDVSALTTLNL
jgi:hypothetical protein